MLAFRVCLISQGNLQQLANNNVFNSIKSISICEGDSRSYSYVLGLSTDEAPYWKDMLFLAKLIPRILHNINRVCYIFGGSVQYTINDITDTRINKYTLGQLRQADHVANTVKFQLNCAVFFIYF